jgi:filamentous hemagglutinin
VTIKYFNVKNGLTTGNITLNAGNSNAVAHTFIGNLQVSNLANLGSNGNVKITGGANGQVLTTDGTGNLTWVTPETSNGGVPGGSNTQVQYNKDGAFGGNANFTFDETSGLLSVTTIKVTDDIYPNANGVADLGTNSNRFNDLYLSGTKIELASSQIRSNTTALIFTNPVGGTFTVLGTGNATTTSLANGNSNVNVNETTVVIGANGNASVMTITGADVGIQGTLGVTGNISAQSNLSVTANLSALNGSFGGNVSATGNVSGGNISTTGSMSATGNISAGNLSTTGTLGVLGNANLSANFNVEGNSVFKSRVIVGTSTEDETAVFLYPNGHTRINSLNVARVNDAGGSISGYSLSITANANLGSLDVGTVNSVGNLSVTGTVNATGAISSGGNITGLNANLGNLVTANFFQGDGHLLTNLTIAAGSAIVNGNSNVTIAPNANVTVSVNGSANVVTFSESTTTFTGNISVANGASITGGNVAITNNLTVNGAITTDTVRNGNSNVTITANGNVSVSAAGSANKLVISSSSVNVAGNLGVSSALNVTGNISAGNISTTEIAATTANINGNLVSLNANLGNLAVANFFQGDGYLLTNLTIAAGSSILNGNSNVLVEANGNVTITAAGNANVVTVTGNSVVFDKQVNGNLATFTTGNITTINANTVNVQNNFTVNANITGYGTITGEALLVQISNGSTGNATIEGNLRVSNDGLFTDRVIIGSSVDDTTSVIGYSNGYLRVNRLVSIRDGTTDGTISAVDLTTTGNSNLSNINTDTINATGNITSLNANLGNLAKANFFQGDGHLLTNLVIPAGTAIENGNSNIFIDANSNIRFGVTGTANVLVVSNTGASLTGTLNVTGNSNVGNLGVARILATGNVTTSELISNGNVSGTNVNATGNVQVSGSITANTGIISNANITATNANLGNLVTANFFQGDGYLLSNLTVSAGSSIVNGSSNVLVTPNSDINFTVEGTANVLKVTTEGIIVTGNVRATQGLANGNTNINILANSDIYMSVGGSANIFKITSNSVNANARIYALQGLTVTGNSNVGNLSASGTIAAGGEISAGSFDTSGALRVGGNANIANISVTGVITAVGNITGGNLVTTGTANVGQLIITSSGANITGNSIFANSVTVEGNASVLGNLTVQGNLTYVNVDTLAIEDPIIELGNGANNTPLTTNDGKDRGTLLHYYTSAPVDAFMGWDNSNGEFAFGSNVTVASEVVTFTQLGNVRAGNFLGNLVGNFSGNISSPGANTQVTFNDGGFINAVSGFTFDKSNTRLSVSNATIDSLTLSTGTSLGVVYRNSTGVLTTGANLTFNGTSLFVTGGVTADDFYGNLRNGSSNIRIIANSNVNISSAGNANIVVVTGTGLNVAGTINATGIITGDGGGLSNIVGANVTGQVGNALVASTVYTNAQPNITSLGTLTGLTSNGVVNFTNASNVSLGAVGNVKITGGTSGYVLSTDGTGNLSWISAPEPTSIANGTSNVRIATSGGNVTTSVAGNANILTVTGTGVNIAGTLNATGVITGNGNGLSNLVGANVTGQVGNALVAGTVYTNAQPNITSVGLLTSLSVGPNSSVVLTGTSGFVRANAIQGTDGVAALYPAYNGVTGAVGVVTNLVVGTSGTGNLVANTGNAIFGSNANVKISGGTSGQALTTDGAGNLSWTTITGGGGTPGGANTQIQFNDSGNFAGNAGLTFNKTTTTLTANNFVATSTANLGNVGNVIITGGSNGYVLTTNGSGNLSWAAQSGGSGANITNNTTANTTYYPVYATSTSGSFTTAGISTTKLQFNPSSGQLTVQDLNTLSDATLKDSPELINDPFSILSQIQGMGFNWKDTGKKSYGVLAQMLEQVLPELVSENAQGKKTVNYIPIIAFLVEAVKQLQSEVEAIKKR